MSELTVHFGDNLAVLRDLPDASVDLIYIDPPFNTGTTRRRAGIAVRQDGAGDRRGFRGRRYRTVVTGSVASFGDVYDDYIGFLRPRMEQAHRILKSDGSLFFHIDYREAAYCRVMLDGVFGRDALINEIIWAYDYGARASRRWPAKHDNIFWYVRNPGDYQFHQDQCDRIPYMAPALVGPEKAAKGKTPTDTWWHTIVSPTGKEKTGYPTQKPLGIVERIVKVHSRPGDMLCDFFAGSGTFGEAAWRHGRNAILVDNNPQAMAVMETRFRDMRVVWRNWPAGRTPQDM